MNTRRFFVGRAIGFFVVLILVGGFYLFNNFIYQEKQAEYIADFKNARYLIDGQVITLSNGYAEHEVAPNSDAKVITRYFGNELPIDLDSDNVEDVAFILTQETGGSGTFYYAVGAVITDLGYVGTEGYLLGDRIAPQTTEVSQNERHKNVVVFNYAERKLDEPMTAPPSVGRSVYLKLVPESMRWAIVEPDFEGESAY